MQMLYNSDSFVVVAFEVPSAGAPQAAAEGTGEAAVSGSAASAAPSAPVALRRGGYEIVDKFARKEIFIEGALAEAFQQGVQALVDQGPTEEAMDEFIGRYTLLAQQPVVLH